MRSQLHHPASKQQLEEVWEKQDHMDQDFNPKTFFYLHGKDYHLYYIHQYYFKNGASLHIEWQIDLDLDGNGFWDQDEVKALFLKELDKLYNEGAPEDDIYERQEEMERMREHVFNEADLNHDGLIRYAFWKLLKFTFRILCVNRLSESHEMNKRAILRLLVAAMKNF